MTDQTPEPVLGARAGLASAAVLIAVITIGARIVGFARIVVFARAVGPATCLGNAYYTANTVPNIVFEIVAGGALASLVIPVLAGPAEQGRTDETGRITSALLSWTLVLLVPVTIAGIWLSRPIMQLLVGTSGRCATNDIVDSGTRMLLLFLPQIVLYGVGVVLAGTLQAHRRFTGPAMAPLLSSIVVIGTYVVFAAVFTGDPNQLGSVSRGDELILAIGTTLGVAALTLSLLVPVFRLRLRLRPNFRFPAGVARRVRALAIAGVATLAAQEIAVAVVLRLANASGPRGAVTVYNLAWTVFLVPWAVLAVPLATSAFPRLSARVAAADDNGFARTSSVSTRAVVLVTLVAAAALAAAADPIARVLAQHGPAATHGDLVSLGHAIAAFAPGLVGYGLVAHLGRALYAKHAGRFAAVAIVIGWLAVIVADLVLVASLSRANAVPALALGNSIGMTISGVLLIVGMTRVAPRAMDQLASTVVLGLIAAAIGALCGRGVADLTASAGVAASVGSGVLAVAVTASGFAMVLLLVSRRRVRRLLAEIR